TAAMGSACDVSGAAHLPAEVTAAIPEVAGTGDALTALRLEGFAASVAHRRETLAALLNPSGAVAMLGAEASQKLWRAVRDAPPPLAAAGGGGRPSGRLRTARSRGGGLGALRARGAAARTLYDGAGGLIWLALAPTDDAGAALVRRARGVTGGHATLVRAPAA